jgi:hypothetical protein
VHNNSDDDDVTSRIRQVVAGNLSEAFAGIGKAPLKPEPGPERVPVIIPPDLGGTPAERLMRNLSTALQRQAEILGQPVDMEDVRAASTAGGGSRFDHAERGVEGPGNASAD